MKDGVRYNIFFVYFIMAKKNEGGIHWTDKVVASDPRGRTYKNIEQDMQQDIREQNDPATIRGDNGDRAHAIAVKRARESHELLRNHELDMVSKGVITDNERRAGIHHTHSMGFARHVLGTRSVMDGKTLAHKLQGGRKRKRKTRRRKTKHKRKTKHRKRRRSSHKKRRKTRHRRRTRRRRR